MASSRRSSAKQPMKGVSMETTVGTDSEAEQQRKDSRRGDFYVSTTELETEDTDIEAMPAKHGQKARTDGDDDGGGGGSATNTCTEASLSAVNLMSTQHSQQTGHKASIFRAEAMQFN